MKLYLTRHGEALPAHINPDRPLSQWGRQQVNQVGRLLNERLVVVKNIYHSGILRARQTAELLAPQVQAHHVTELAGLCPEDAVEPMQLEIAAWTQSTLLVGHLPYMAYLVEALAPGSTGVVFNTATVVCLARAGQRWKVDWVLHPQREH